MSKQSVYTVHSGDECGGDPCYNVLKGPAGFECWLAEPEDRSFWRDLAPVVERLEHLEQSNAQLREQNRVLRANLVNCAARLEACYGEDYPAVRDAKAALTATSQPEPCTNHFSDGSKIFPSRDCCKPATSQEGQHG